MKTTFVISKNTPASVHHMALTELDKWKSHSLNLVPTNFIITAEDLDEDSADKALAYEVPVIVEYNHYEISSTINDLDLLTIRDPDRVVLDLDVSIYSKDYIYFALITVAAKYRTVRVALSELIGENSISSTEWNSLIQFCYHHKIKMNWEFGSSIRHVEYLKSQA